MAEMITPGPVCEDRCIREAVCINTKKIMDSCRDKDCIEDLRVYFDETSQGVVDQAASVKVGKVELIYANVTVDEVQFNKGFYTVDVQYYYRVTVDISLSNRHPAQVIGLAVFNKRCVLFGGQGCAKVFSSKDRECTTGQGGSVPEAVVEVVSPLALCAKLVDINHHCPSEGSCIDIPKVVADCFPECLTTGGCMHRVYVTIGQFSIIRLVRETQLLIPAYDYYIPSKECACDNGECQKNPCELFQKVQFPVNDFCACKTSGSGEKTSC